MNSDMIRDTLPNAEEFYKTYWNKKPFIVRGAIDPAVFDDLIDPDTLAGLALEGDIKSRLVKTSARSKKSDWSCLHGPLDEQIFATLGSHDWTLLVQNVEQYHLGTARLLDHFRFAPRWLMDDIMVSYSVAGGGVGAHVDSYHVFLVQGQGKRKWKVGYTRAENQECIEGIDLKVLKNGFDGEEIETTIGDVIYIPPHFIHEGSTIDEALTFSVGFLGPQLSEMLIAYGCYLEDSPRDKRFGGDGIGTDSAGATMAFSAAQNLQDDLIDVIKSDDFMIWMAQYFATPTHEDPDNIDPREDPLSAAEILDTLAIGQALYRPAHIKPVITTAEDGTLTAAVLGHIINTTDCHADFIKWFADGAPLRLSDIEKFADKNGVMDIITALYNRNVLFFEGELSGDQDDDDTDYDEDAA